MSDINHQDWKPVIVSKSKEKNASKPQVQIDHHTKVMRQLDKADEPDVIRKVSESDRKTIIDLRVVKKLNQEELAKRLSIRKEIVRDIENGSHAEDKQLTSRIIRYLNSLPVPQIN